MCLPMDISTQKMARYVTTFCDEIRTGMLNNVHSTSGKIYRGPIRGKLKPLFSDHYI